MPNLSWNSQVWTEENTWVTDGEEWSGAWGNSEAQWFGSLYPRLHRLLPARAILEIAPGFGRWTRFLLPLCEHYVGIDLSSTCVSACSQKFSTIDHAVFYQNDGLSLSSVANESIDLAFSFDSLVHCELDVFESYIPQLLGKLTSTGIAFIHHSNRFDITHGEQASPSIHYRAESVSAERVASLVTENHGTVLIQEAINWGTVTLDDCITIFGKSATFGECETASIKNKEFMTEASLIQRFQCPYSSHLSQCLSQYRKSGRGIGS